MIRFHHILLIIGLLAFSACKKVKERENSEKYFTLYFVNIERVQPDSGDSYEVLVPIETCFDRVYGKGRSALLTCSNYKEGFKLPLNITADSSRFFFEKGLNRDSITIYYKTIYEGGGNEFEVIYHVDRIGTSFKSFTRKCIKDITTQCSSNEAFLSGTVF